MSWRWGVDWFCGISSLILQRQPSAGWNKEGGMIGLCGWHRASLKSICVPVSDHKGQALQESSSLSSGVGFSAFFLQSAWFLFVCAAMPSSLPKNSASLLISSDRFSHFPPFSGGFVSAPLPSLSLFRSILPILSRGFPGCIWLTSGLVWSSKKPCCYHLQMNSSMCQCLYGNSVGHKMLSSTGGDVGSYKCEKRREMRGSRKNITGRRGVKDKYNCDSDHVSGYACGVKV